MARSFKHTPIHGNTNQDSEKDYKTQLHRKERVMLRVLMANQQYDLVDIDLLPRGQWGPKDGKQYWDEDPKLMRK